MEQNVNLVVENFKNSIIATINNSGLPPAVVYYVAKDVFKDIESSYMNFLNQSREAEAHARSEEKATAAATEENSQEEEYLPQD